MPLVDEQTRATDRRRMPVWPWVLVAVGLAGLWLMAAVAISFWPRMARQAAPPPNPIHPINEANLQQAQAMAQWGQWAQAASIVRAVDAGTLTPMQKHQYFRVGAQSLTKSGSPAAGAELYERFMGMAVLVRDQECQTCHASAIAPGKLKDMESSQLGAGYVSALKQAGKLEARRKQLRGELKKKPDDPRLNLLLYHLSKAANDKPAMLRHSEKLQAFDAKQAGGSKQ